MTAQNFAPALGRALVHEGAYVNHHPKDPGGATMKGMTQRVYDAYRERRRLPLRSVRLIDDAELREIYRRQYLGRREGRSPARRHRPCDVRWLRAVGRAA